MLDFSTDGAAGLASSELSSRFAGSLLEVMLLNMDTWNFADERLPMCRSEIGVWMLNSCYDKRKKEEEEEGEDGA